MRTMITRAWDDLLISLHTTEAPDDEGWRDYSQQLLALVLRYLDEPDKVRRLVFTDGGSPNLVQRADINKILAGRPVKVAIVSSTQATQGVVTALNWYNPLIRFFAPSQIAEAWQHLDVKQPSLAFVMNEVVGMQREVGSVRALEAALAAFAALRLH